MGDDAWDGEIAWFDIRLPIPIRRGALHENSHVDDGFGFNGPSQFDLEHFLAGLLGDAILKPFCGAIDGHGLEILEGKPGGLGGKFKRQTEELTSQRRKLKLPVQRQLLRRDGQLLLGFAGST